MISDFSNYSTCCRREIELVLVSALPLEEIQLHLSRHILVIILKTQLITRFSAVVITRTLVILVFIIKILLSLGVRGPGNQQKHLEYIAGSG